MFQKRLPYLFLCFAVFCMALACSAKAGPPGIDVQWRYDAATKAVVLHLTNTSNQDITAYNISVTVKHTDGSVDSSEMLEDFLPLMATVAEHGGALRDKYGDGSFIAGTNREKVLPQTKEVSQVIAVADVVAYDDHTVDVANDRAFGHLAALRGGVLAASKHAADVLKQTNSNAGVENELTRLAEVSKGKTSATTDAPESHMEVTFRNLANQAKSADLSELSKELNDRIAFYSAHAKLVRKGGQQ